MTRMRPLAPRISPTRAPHAFLLVCASRTPSPTPVPPGRPAPPLRLQAAPARPAPSEATRTNASGSDSDSARRAASLCAPATVRLGGGSVRPWAPAPALRAARRSGGTAEACRYALTRRPRPRLPAVARAGLEGPRGGPARGGASPRARLSWSESQRRAPEPTASIRVSDICRLSESSAHAPRARGGAGRGGGARGGRRGGCTSGPTGR